MSDSATQVYAVIDHPARALLVEARDNPIQLPVLAGFLAAGMVLA